MNRLKSRPLLSILLLCLLSACVGSNRNKSNYSSIEDWVVDVKSGINEIDNSRLVKLQNEGSPFLLIDVRTGEEHDLGYIPGSVLIPRGLIEFRIGNPEFWEEEGLYDPLKEDTIILYCRSGNRSALAAESLKKLGYKNVYSLQGGFSGWTDAYPENIEINLPQLNPNQIGPVAVDDQAGSC